ncbi:SCO family protein [Sandaracinobacter sp. RS1-74]|uniref:SCO family protein n=1 Tax=Sandaracinobacteroides sayramensis TaxID=2913411 RepID=UPI001EDAC1E2|nr:SCO family protein [Sandaracinobacteroides sayramensis]MCG2842702.1 SCO family protein [Sandaracinobacteroides sayramensis]
MNSPQPSKARASRLPFILLAVALALLAALWFLRPEKGPEGNLTGAAVGGPFSLVDETGAAVGNDSYDGKWRLMYFGFTYCPDICPTDAAKMAAALKSFEEKHPEAAQKLQPLFVTVDPERDTPEALREFTDSFHPKLIGLTGSRAQVDAALKTFRIYASKVPGVTEGSYTYDHLAIFYLMDPEGKPVEFLASTTATPEQVAAMLERFVA